MAHSNRKSQREKRKAQKAARKAARQAEWAAIAGTSKNKKKKTGGKGRVLAKPARVLMEVLAKVNGVLVPALRMVHGGADCRNIGCKRCSPLWRVA